MDPFSIRQGEIASRHDDDRDEFRTTARRNTPLTDQVSDAAAHYTDFPECHSVGELFHPWSDTQDLKWN